MKVDKKTVDQIAHLARLEFGDEGTEKMVTDMNRMVEFVNKLNELDTENVEPLIYMTDETNVLRADEVKNEVSQKEALKNAPKKDS
ncbi:MAG: Asp-tRNA(Asn)/Glu-tRNA(Gln) amidotransferase subunit GatC, partial [Bacteroidia bacterium]|nr:Asp-tRNA(Asn)/Glu-tRNA(Gln) amidotransferase subunit GatC [Bacteroidia bacterium]